MRRQSGNLQAKAQHSRVKSRKECVLSINNPLKPADTSSPRDTLRSFLTDVNIAIGNWQKGENLTSATGFRAFERAVSTLDFSTTPYSDARTVITRRILMLLEIFSRIDLPSYGEIPGDANVAQGDLKRWTIPGTSISIERIEKGPRAGEFHELLNSLPSRSQLEKNPEPADHKSDCVGS